METDCREQEDGLQAMFMLFPSVAECRVTAHFLEQVKTFLNPILDLYSMMSICTDPNQPLLLHATR